MLKNSVVQVGIVGFGHIGKRHFQVVQSTEDAVVVGIADRDVAKARSTAGDVPVVASIEELLQTASVDVIILCTPSALHSEQACQAAESGVHVITEKPLATTREDAHRMIQCCADNGVLLTVIYQYRFLQTAQRLRELLQNGDLGEILFANAEVFWRRDPEYFLKDGGWRAGDNVSGGGTLINQGVHAIDLLCWLIGPLQSVSASVANRVSAIAAEDTVAALLQFRNGTLGILQATTAAATNGEMKIAIQGTKGTAVLEGRTLRVDCEERNGGDRISIEDIIPAEIDLRSDLHRQQLESTFQLLRNADTSTEFVVDGMVSLEAALAMYEAARSERIIFLDDSEKEGQLS